MEHEDDIIRLASEANRIALRVSRTEYRKFMGLAYIYWSSLSIVYSIFFAVVYEFGIKAMANSLITSIATSIISILYTAVFIKVILGRFKRTLVIKRGGYTKRYLYYYLPIITLIIVFNLVLFITNNVIICSIIGAIFALVIVVFYMYRPMVTYGVRPRYYDYMAWIAYVLSMIIGPFYYVAYYIALAVYMFAGMASLLEVIEGG